MDRRNFFNASKCGLAGLMAGPLVFANNGAAEADARQAQQQTPPPPRQKRPRYKIEIEIFEARTDSWCHKKGDTFAYPVDWGKLCPWLRASLNEFVRIMESGVTLPWMYENTPYAKVSDPEGVSTEYVRCPDPTSALVAKITRTRVG
jgi:uncharacterized repeat protein (TIGR04076 family)